MIRRVGTGWQTTLADLSLILFVITAAALSQAGDGKDMAGIDMAGRGPEASAQAEPLSIYRTGKNAPPLGQWLAAQSADPRQLLTIVSTYRPGKQAEALATAEKLAEQADEAGRKARIVVEPGDGEAGATLAFDQPSRTMNEVLARSLLQKP